MSNQNTHPTILTKKTFFLSTLAFFFIAQSSTAQANSCVTPKSYYKNVICTSDKSYFLAVKDSGKPAALLNKSGKRVVSLLKYDKVLAAKFHAGLLPIQKDGRVGYINTGGLEVIPALYQPLDGKNWARAAYNDRIVVKRNNGWGVISTKNRNVLPFSRNVETISDFKNGKAKVSQSNASFWIGKDGKTISASSSNSKISKSNSTSTKTDDNNRKNKTHEPIGASEVVLTPEQIKTKLKLNNIGKTLSITEGSDFISLSKPTKTTTKVKEILKKTSNKEAIDEIDSLRQSLRQPKPFTKNKERITAIKKSKVKMTETLIPLSDKVLKKKPSKAEVEFFPHQASGKWGFVDKNNVNMIVYTFNQVEGFSEGLAGVKIDDKWGFLDKAGDLVISFRFEEAGVDRKESNYKGKPPFVFINGKAWVGNLINGSKVCINPLGVNVECETATNK